MIFMKQSSIDRLLTPEDCEAFNAFLAQPGAALRFARAWLAERGYQAGASSVYRYMCRRGHTPRETHYAMKVDKTLSEEHRVEYEKLLSLPQTTQDKALAWLKERGYAIGKGAMSRHRRRFLRELEQLRRSARLAQATAQVAREHGTAVMSEGALTRFEQIVMEQLHNRDLEVFIPPETLTEMSRSVSNAVASREKLESIRREFEKKAHSAAAEAAKAARKGADPMSVVRRVRQILGVPPEEDEECPAPPWQPRNER